MEKGEEYGIRDVWKLNLVQGPYGRSLWEGIIRHLDAYKSGIGYEVGKGDVIGFWEDRWCGIRSLQEDHLDLFMIAENRLAKVCDYKLMLPSRINVFPNFKEVCF